ncbi:MAG TPA: hypothetical protein VLA99_03950 [Nitrospiraceae bacterium]|nr:hypothetical protein [Nitrospiraceae bacterium]
MLAWLIACALGVSFLVEPLRASPPASPATPNPADVAERNRLLDQEIRLSARPQTYLVLDLQAGQLLIKARGLELHRLAISSWASAEFDRLVGPFYLKTRPPILRTKSGSPDDPSARPIELSDMPSAFELPFDPPLVISVEASTHRSVWARLRSHVARWWHSLARLSHALSDASPSANNLRPLMISLSLEEEDAQSLAWTVTDGMPLLILRQASP